MPKGQSQLKVLPAVPRSAVEWSTCWVQHNHSQPSVPARVCWKLLLPDETRVLATVRMLNTPFGQLAVVQSRDAALAGWRSLTTLTVTLSATTGFVVLILGFAFHWQATRAREADLIYETVRTRIDTALNRGRCGLWDWDLARGRIFWSQSMFEILGLDTKYDLLSFGDVNALVHPDDVRLYQLAAELADATTTTIDHAFRMRHAAGHWVWLRARCELVRQPGEPGLHLIGIAVDITEQKNLVEKTFAADMRLRDAIETIPRLSFYGTPKIGLVLCNSNFQELHRPSRRSDYRWCILRGRWLRRAVNRWCATKSSPGTECPWSAYVRSAA